MAYSNLLHMMTALRKLWVGIGVFLTLAYLYFRVGFTNFEPVWIVPSLLLLLAELHMILHLVGLLYSKFPRKYVDYRVYDTNDLFINTFICVCGEPSEIVERTIRGALKARDYYAKEVNSRLYPRIIVLNDGKAGNKDNWREIEDLCRRLGVLHVARDTNEGFKAGNINNGIDQFPAHDRDKTIDIVLDADMAPYENMLVEIVKPLSDSSVDFVQSPQQYVNEDDSWVAQAAGAHQIFFFEHICPAKAADNALFLCGTNFAIRRSAWESIGGMDEQFITEDYATSIALHESGKKGVFVPEVLAVGYAPGSLQEYFNQQLRWAKGSFDTSIFYFRRLFLGTLTWRQKWHYLLSATYYLIGIRDLILILGPLPYLLFGVPLIDGASHAYIVLLYLPFLLFNLVWYGLLFRSPWKSMVLDVVSFPVFISALVQSVRGVNLGFKVTIKKYGTVNPFAVYRVQLLTALLLLLGLWQALVSESSLSMVNYFWAGLHTVFLMAGFVMVVKESVSWPRFNVNWDGSLHLVNPRLAWVISFVMILTMPFSQNLSWAVDEWFRPLYATTYSLDAPKYGVYYGYYLPHLNSHPGKPVVKLHKDEQPSLAMYHQDWTSGNGFNSNYMKDLDAAGVVPVVTWEPRGVDSFGGLAITPETIISGRYDGYIRDWAKGAALYQKPFFLRFAHEMNGNWYAWGSDSYDSDRNYIAMWRHVHDIFEEEGADNVIWIWSPHTTDVNGEVNTMDMFYPGDDYVDWIGFNVFNYGNKGGAMKWSSFDDVADAAYRQVSTYNKPIMITGLASVSSGGNKSWWFVQTLSVDIPQRPLIKGVVFYNDNQGTADLSVGSGMDSNTMITNLIVYSRYYLKGLGGE